MCMTFKLRIRVFFVVVLFFKSAFTFKRKQHLNTFWDNENKSVKKISSDFNVRGLSIKYVDFPHNSGSFQYFITKFL